MRFPFQVDFPSARIFTFGWLLSKPGTGKKPARQPHPRTVFRRSKGRERTPETPKSGKSGPLYAKEGETHNNTGFCSFLYFFSRIRTYVLTMAEKNLYISPPKPGTAPKALEKKCNKLVTLQNRSVRGRLPAEGGPFWICQKETVRAVPGRFPAARHSKKAGAGGQSLPPLSYARRHDSDGNPHGDPLADFAGPPAEDCHEAGPTLFPALRPPPVTAQPTPVAGLPAS